MAVPAFSLRLPPALREAVRALAEAEGISQNELLEQATAREVVARGALRANDLERAAEVMRSLTTQAHTRLVDASITAFVEGEALPDPISTRRVETGDEPAEDAKKAVGLAAQVAAVFHR